jgi:hypothetical protein
MSGMGIPAHEVRDTGVPPVFMGKDAHATAETRNRSSHDETRT